MEPVPSDGRGRDLFLVALRIFSDSCNPPVELHSTCPFSIETSRGRVCGEECSDILDAHEPKWTVGEIELTSSLSAIPRPKVTRPAMRRPRMGPALNSVPFDAKMIYDDEQSYVTRRKSPTSLIKELEKQLSFEQVQIGPNVVIDLSLVHELLTELDVRGFDTEELLRGVIYPQMAVSYAIQLVVLLKRSDDTVVDHSVWVTEQWHEIASTLGIDETGTLSNHDFVDAPNSRLVATLLPEVIPRIQSWLNQQRLMEIDVLQIPSVSTYLSFEKAESIGGSTSSWLFDRFCTTYLDGWRRTSLESEWRYVVDHEQSPIDQSQMNFRRIERESIACEIAARSMSSSMSHRSGSMNPSQFIPKALDLLKNRDFSAAATVFDVICQLNPHSSDAFNNRGFCRIPTDIESALKDFDHATELGIQRSLEPLTVGNRMYCYMKLNRSTSALEVAEKWWNSNTTIGSAQDLTTCVMWDFEGAEPVVRDYTDSRIYICQLARHVASINQDVASSQRWSLREQEIRGD